MKVRKEEEKGYIKNGMLRNDADANLTILFGRIKWI